MECCQEGFLKEETSELSWKNLSAGGFSQDLHLGWVQLVPRGPGMLSNKKGRRREPGQGSAEPGAKLGSPRSRDWELSRTGRRLRYRPEDAISPRAKTFPGSQLEGPGCTSGVSVGTQGKGGNFPRCWAAPGRPCEQLCFSFLLTALSPLLLSQGPRSALPALAQPGAGPEFCWEGPC